MNWEDTFRAWGAPPGKTEKEKMENTEIAVKKAIQNDDTLSEMDISVFAQGSYKANTIVKQDSDVDICVCLNSLFFSRYPEGKTREDYGNTTGSIFFAEFKKLVEIALINHFGIDAVTRGNKAFDVHSNSYRVDADVLPAFAYRYYCDSGENNYIKPVGVSFLTDKSIRINNWPKQAYQNGISKQNNTRERYKKIVRIIKKLRNKMQEDNITAAQDVPSFLIESMVWNVPDECFNHDDYYNDVKWTVATSFNKTIKEENCKVVREVNNIKYLFRSSQPWTWEQAYNFFRAAWNYVDFE